MKLGTIVLLILVAVAICGGIARCAADFAVVLDQRITDTTEQRNELPID